MDERHEIKGLINQGLDYDGFCAIYFKNEPVNHLIFQEFYEDFVNSRKNISDYIKDTVSYY